MNINSVSIHVFMLNSSGMDGESRNIHSPTMTQVCHSLTVMMGYSQLSQRHPSIAFVYTMVQEPAFCPILVKNAASDEEGYTGHYCLR